MLKIFGDAKGLSKFCITVQKDQNNLAKTEIQSTRMHSSRIRAVRSLPYAGGLCLGVSLIETPGQRHPSDKDPPRQVSTFKAR